MKKGAKIKTELHKRDKTTEILFDDASSIVEILTHNTELKKRLSAYAAEYVSKLLGKETIDMNTYGQSKGRNGSYSRNDQITGRELMTPDEVRRLDNKYALLFVRGEYPVQDFKYDILHHPNVSRTTDGGAESYRHGEDLHSFAVLGVNETLLKACKENPVDEDD